MQSSKSNPNSNPNGSRTIQEIKDSKKRVITQTGVFVFFITMLMSIVVWDMRKVAMISEVIHDDHTELWEHVNDTSLKQWLSPLDLCLLQGVKDANADIKTFRMKNCTKAFQQSITALPSGSTISPGSQRLFCNIGASLGKVCPGPLSTRTFFRSRLRHPHYSDANNRHLSLALRHMAKKNMPLILIGDGISKQNQDAMICDLMRTDKVAITSGTNAGSGTKNPNDYSYFTDYTVRWKEEKLKLDIRYYKVFRIEDEDDNANDGEDSFDFEFKFDLFGFNKAQKERKERDRERKAQRRNRRLTTNIPSIMSTRSPLQVEYGQKGGTGVYNSVNSTDRLHKNKSVFISNSFGNNSTLFVVDRERLRKSKNGTAVLDNQSGMKLKRLRENGTAASLVRENKERRPLKLSNNTFPQMRFRSGINPSNTTLSRTSVSRNSSAFSMRNTKWSPSAPKLSLNLTVSHIASGKRTLLESRTNVTTQSQQGNSTATGIILPRYSFQQIKSVINDFIQSTNRSVTIIANAGVWYNSREKFRRELPTLLSWLDDLAKDEDHHHMIFYRETAAQHWNHSINGYYDREYRQKEENNGTCVPIEDNTPGNCFFFISDEFYSKL